jgi:hypothetical protein
MLQERDIFTERQESKPASFVCPFCRERGEYEVRWLTRRKKTAPRNLRADDRARFEKSRDYMVRIDDTVNCANARCRRKFEIPNSQTVVFIENGNRL